MASGELNPGEETIAELVVIDGGFSKTLLVGDILKFGAPDHTIGEFEILDIHH